MGEEEGLAGSSVTFGLGARADEVRQGLSEGVGLLGLGVLYFNTFLGSGFLLQLLIPKKYIPFFQGLLHSRGLGLHNLQHFPHNHSRSMKQAAQLHPL